MIIIHGDNLVLARNRLAEVIAEAKVKNQKITRLEAKAVTPASLQEALGSASLFGEQKLLIIEELHSLPTSKKKKELISQISATVSGADNGTPTTQIVLFEKKKLTATMLKKFQSQGTNRTQIFEFKISNSLWKLLDFIGNHDKTKTLEILHQAIAQNDEYFVFTMICRQIRMLIETKAGGILKGAPFMISKLKSQASKFTLPQLLKLHTQIFQIDLSQKTSSTPYTLTQQLDLLLIKM